MSLVSKVGARRPRARFAMAVVYGLLILGSLTTLYPFLLMVMTGMKGPTDQNDNRLMPEYFGTVAAAPQDWSKPSGTLLGKYVDDKYAGDLAHMQSTRVGPATVDSKTIEKYEQFLMSLDVADWQAGFRLAPNQVTSRLNIRYQEWLKTQYATIEQLNRAYTEENVGFNFATPPTEALDRAGWKPPTGSKWSDWLRFKATLPAEFRIPIRYQRVWQEFIRGTFKGQFASVPPTLAGNAKKFEELTIARVEPYYSQFVKSKLPASFQGDMPRSRAEETWLAEAGTEVLPIQAYESSWVQTHAPEIRNEFASRNYRFVVNYILLNGRSLLNTAIYCALLICAQLLVNPLAAYALSRYPIRATGKILVLLLATMAFPAEVAMIPSFLLLKQAGLLNTFWALVLPGAASGYMIYLLKGFFDSLPQELFESGQIDGAKESTMLFKIAIPLSRPVLGYLALLAFMAAYGAFLFAFLIVQDRSMWTLMVSIYQLQIIAPRAVVMAALTLAAIPTLVVFLAAQRVIMRGIVLPGER